MASASRHQPRRTVVRTGGGLPSPSMAFKGVAELELWSEFGVDRKALLEALQIQFTATGSPWDSDDGWRDWDLEFFGSKWWRVRMGTVTEYHENGRNLTRVRIASRATAECVIVYVLSALAACALVVIFGLNPVWALGVLFVWCVLFESRHHRAVRGATNTVVQTAAMVGMKPVP